MRSVLLAAAAVVGLAIAAPAGATVFEVDFDVAPGSWIQGLGSGSPYGLPADPSLSGSFTVDDASAVGNLVDGSAVTSLNWVTGTRTWTLTDIDVGGSFVTFGGGTVTGFNLAFDPTNDVGFPNTASINDGTSQIFCNGCVSIAGVSVVGGGGGVPEPASWALMLAGFFGLGGALRQQRRVVGPQAMVDPA